MDDRPMGVRPVRCRRSGTVAGVGICRSRARFRDDPRRGRTGLARFRIYQRREDAAGDRGRPSLLRVHDAPLRQGAGASGRARDDSRHVPSRRPARSVPQGDRRLQRRREDPAHADHRGRGDAPSAVARRDVSGSLRRSAAFGQPCESGLRAEGNGQGIGRRVLQRLAAAARPFGRLPRPEAVLRRRSVGRAVGAGRERRADGALRPTRERRVGRVERPFRADDRRKGRYDRFRRFRRRDRGFFADDRLRDG